jgi:hypothetical protein
MKSMVTIPLNAQSAQFERLVALQEAFADVCNALAPMVQRSRVWNRVALHHMAYRDLRARYPAMGSQMICNAIYSVSRTCRVVFQAPNSPFHLSRLGDRGLPLLRFTRLSPVYFDRHTLSLKGGQISMYTLDGRMRFQLALTDDYERAFIEKKLYEIVLQRRAEQFCLTFTFDAQTLQPEAEPVGQGQGLERAKSDLPEYVLIEELA